MSENVQSLLDLVADSVLLHQGGEADIYKVSVKDRAYILKWYKSPSAYDIETIQKIASLNYEGLYKIREFGERENHSYVLYDYLSAVASSELQISVVVALYILRRLVKTLEFLKAQDLYHGDLNPGNVLLTVRNGLVEPVLIDCGIVGPGALAYAAPERFQGKNADEKSDLYSLGMLLFRLIYGSELVVAKGYDEFAGISLNIDGYDISQKLYASAKFSVAEISALEPIWKALIRANAGDRAEDLDELDELLEIALNQLAVGEVGVQKEVRSFAEREIQEKTLQKVPMRGEIALPYKIMGCARKFCYWKHSILLVFVLILIVLAFLVLKSEKPEVDAAGDLVLKKSRSLETMDSFSDSMRSERADGLVDTSLLNDLPMPEFRE